MIVKIQLICDDGKIYRQHVGSAFDEWSWWSSDGPIAVRGKVALGGFCYKPIAGWVEPSLTQADPVPTLVDAKEAAP